MASFNNQLDQCLDILYGYSGNFKISIELIQKLAQQLKLETFIDKHAYTVNPEPKFQQLKSQRLSIAGSLILVDIDFTDDKSIIHVSLSLGNQINQNVQNDQQKDSFYTLETNDDNVKVIKLDVSKKSMLFFDKLSGTESSVAETILLKNLTEGMNLDRFPSNLKYLATLDKFSSSNNDLFVYIEDLALVLNGIYQIEVQDQDDWLYKEGLANSIGKISLNNQQSLELGLFIDFWRDYRYINQRYMQENNTTDLLEGKNYRILVSIEANPLSDISTGFLSKSQESSFKLVDKDQSLISHKLEIYNSSLFDNDSTKAQWSINLIFNHPIYLPAELLDYSGFKYKVHATNMLDPNRFDAWDGRTFKTVESNISVQANNHISAALTPIDSIQVSSLQDILFIIPILRNFLVLDNIIQTLTQYFDKLKESFDNIQDSTSKEYENKLTEEAKKRIRESLKLSNDVTDDELLSLNAITNNDEATLDSILKSSNEDLTNSEEENFIILSIEEMDIKSDYNDLTLSFESNLDSNKLNLRFKITNGIVTGYKSDMDSMLIDSDVNEDRFIKGLNLTEDIIKVLNYIYVS